ncbi:MAG: hemolysin family protein [Clostridiales bacterium]|nr:hemolysin family protein [Clostridiales bacterium]
MDDPIGRWLAAILLLVGLALLCLAQSVWTNANEGRIRAAADAGDRRAKRLVPLLGRRDTLTALRGLRTLFLMGFAALGARMLESTGMSFLAAAAVFCLAAAPAVMALCKLAPEKIGRKNADKWVCPLAGMLRSLTALTTPFTVLETGLARGLVRLFGVDPSAGDEQVTEEEIRALVDKGGEKGVIESDEKEMINNVFEFGDLTAADCMTHRTDVTALWIRDDEETIRKVIKESGLSRFPVYDEDIDDIVGILSTREYLLNAGEKNPKPLKALLREAYFVPETVPTDVLLRNMQHAKTHIAIVVDEYGGMSGIVTMEDLLEEIVGNIYDEFDPAAESEIQPLPDGSFRVSGTADLDSVSEAIGAELPHDEDYDTLGGLIFSRFSTIPQDGTKPELTLYLTPDGEKPEEGEAARLHIQVESIEDRRIEWARIRVIPPEGSGETGPEE